LSIETRWAYYSKQYMRTEVQCKSSVWHPNALPRIGEDGGLCGRLAYMQAGGLSCRGQPSLMLGQPGHAAAMAYSRDGAGHWKMDKYSWITTAYWTQSFADELSTDDIPGAVKNREVPVDYLEAVAHAMNVGLDSWLDVRLALLLYNAVYTAEGDALLPPLVNLLLDTLQVNPHYMEAWDVIFTHISLTTISSDAIIARAFNIFRPVAGLYTKTFEKLLMSLATQYDCPVIAEGAQPSGPLEFLLSEIDAVVPSCDVPTRVAMKAAILPCLSTAYTGLGAVRGFEADLVRLAWNECDEYTNVVKFNLTSSSSPRTNFAKPDMPPEQEAFMRLMKTLFGGSMYSYGLAGTSSSDIAAIIEYLEELSYKLPLGFVGPMRDGCTDDLSQTMNFWGDWQRTGRVWERSAYSVLRQTLKRYYNLIGEQERATLFDYTTEQRRADPLALEAAGQLATPGDEMYSTFKSCAGLGRRRLEGAERLPAPREPRMKRRLADDVDADTLDNYKLDASSGGGGVQGAEGRLQDQTALTSEDYAVIGTSHSSLVINPEQLHSYANGLSPSPPKPPPSPVLAPPPSASPIVSPSPSPPTALPPPPTTPGSTVVHVVTQTYTLSSEAVANLDADTLAQNVAKAAGVDSSDVSLTLEVKTQLTLDADVASLDISALKESLAPVYGVEANALKLAASAGSAVLEVTITAPADASGSSIASAASTISAGALSDAIGVDTSISASAETSVVSTISVASADAAESMAATLAEATATPELASAALGVTVNSVTPATAQAIEVPSTDAGTVDAGAIVGGVIGGIALVIAVIGLIMWRKRSMMAQTKVGGKEADATKAAMAEAAKVAKAEVKAEAKAAKVEAKAIKAETKAATLRAKADELKQKGLVSPDEIVVAE